MRIQGTIIGDDIITTCPFCGGETTVHCSAQEMDSYMQNVSVNEQNFPRMRKFDREALITGMCHECQEATFHTPAPGNEAAFGKRIGDCECCGAPIWECDKIGGKYVCVQCGEEFEN